MLGRGFWRAGVAAVLVSFAAAGPVGADTTSAPQARWEASTIRVEPLGGALIVNGAAYRGAIEVLLGPAGMSVVNEVALEDYVLGVREVPPSWPAEAQRAQAIAARSYALHQALKSRQAGRPVDLCSTTACQVYDGMAAEDKGGRAWSEAVVSTASQVLAYRGAPILAMYSSSNGGQSLPGGQPYLRAVADPDDAASPHHRWRVEVSEQAIGSAVGLPEGAVLTGIGREGAAVVARWEGPVPEEPEVSKPVAVTEFRRRLEAVQSPPEGMPRLLPSTRFALGPADTAGQVRIEGGGWGHGIGMSQHGALGKARRGLDAAAILAAYYGGLRPVTASAGQVPATIRVDLGLGGASVRLGSSGPVRVHVDGRDLGISPATVEWSVSLRSRKLALSGPAGGAVSASAPPSAPPASADPFSAESSLPPFSARLAAAPLRTGADVSLELAGFAAALLLIVGLAALRPLIAADWSRRGRE